MTRMILACAVLLAVAPSAGAIAGQTGSAREPLWFANDGTNCMALYEPVCAVKDGVRFTYSNACYAHRAGARVISRRSCGDTDRFRQDRD